jgi:hypothetical protein
LPRRLALPPIPARVLRRSTPCAVAACLALVGASSVHRPLLHSTPLTEPGLAASVSTDGSDPRGLISEGQRPDPIDFSPEELRELQRRFGVHGPQPALAQLFTKGIDNLKPLRSYTVNRLEELRPTILRESRRRNVNPMLVAAVLFDEMRHAKPGEDLPLAAQSGLFQTHGPAQLGVSELVHQGLLSPTATPEEVAQARLKLLDPERNVELLVGKFARLTRALGLPTDRPLEASRSPRDAKGLATLAYLHNGKLDYPGRILSSMQDPELHALIYSVRKPVVSPLI